MKLILSLVIAAWITTAVGFAENPPPPDERADYPPRQEMTNEQKAEAEQKVNEAWSKLPLESKLRLMRLHQALREMPPQDRRFIHDRVERFLNMSPEERAQLRQNRERWEKMTPEEREQARQEFRKRREEIEQKWREEHPGEEPPFRLHTHQPPPSPPVDKPGDGSPPPINEPNP
jgi:hypothetical protein